MLYHSNLNLQDMTREEIKKFLDNTKVYVNGKSKEIQEKLFSFGYRWADGNNTEVCKEDEPFLLIYDDGYITYENYISNFVDHENREISADEILSLEITEPTYRPFKDAEECWQEMLKHQPFGWFKSKVTGNFAHVGNVCQFENKADITWSTNEKEYFTLDSVFETYTFADGTPFGIKEE